MYAFKTVNKVRLDVDFPDSSDKEYFDEEFFGSLALHGIRSLELCTYDEVKIAAKAALAFGFPEYSAEGDRQLAGISLKAKNNLLAKIRKVIYENYDSKIAQIFVLRVPPGRGA